MATKVVDEDYIVPVIDSCFNNVDDHERNFSFINDGSGIKFSPAYDLTPSLVSGAYHAAGFQYQPTPPRPSEAIKGKGLFRLGKARTQSVAEEIIEVVNLWSDFAEASNLSEVDSINIRNAFNL